MTTVNVGRTGNHRVSLPSTKQPVTGLEVAGNMLGVVGMVALPCLVIYALTRRQTIEGLAAGGCEWRKVKK